MSKTKNEKKIKAVTKHVQGTNLDRAYVRNHLGWSSFMLGVLYRTEGMPEYNNIESIASIFFSLKDKQNAVDEGNKLPN